MPKYIVESVSVHRHIHIVDAPTEELAKEISKVADANYDKFVEQIIIDVNEYTEDQMAHFRQKEYFWDGVSYFDGNRQICYKQPEVKF